jgi:pyrimidine-nucleoside phosphorylase
VNVTDIIASKRDRQELTAQQLTAAVAGFVRGEVSEAQMAALLMAIVLNGMTARESADLTLAMVNTGQRLDLSGIPGVKVDKHSTGGVGDKTTLVVAPLVAALGVPVPKMSGRALGHTGGTIDKLECIPGLTTDLSPERFSAQVADIGLAIAAQTTHMVPADKMIYALRDAIAAVESIPLIASSVMSKKLAAGADAIVLDVKAGRGAFMADVAHAHLLAQTMVEIGVQHGKRVVALVTRMEQPLGRAVGDALELAEAVSALSGRGPRDLVELCQLLAAHMLVLGGAAADLARGWVLAEQGLASGQALAKFRQMVTAQGGAPQALDDPERLFCECERIPVPLDQQGVLAALDARRIGLAIRDLKAAAGEKKHACGVWFTSKVGDAVGRQPIGFVVAPSQARAAAEQAVAQIRAACQVGEVPPSLPDLVAATISS